MKYLCDLQIIPTNTCPPDLAELSKRSEFFAQFSKWVQLDIADGIFAPTVSWPYGNGQMPELENMEGLPEAKRLQYEIHLMVQRPREIGCSLARAGAERIIGHTEAFDSVDEAHGALDAWRQNGASEAGLTLLLDTPLALIEPLVSACDVVQLMAIARIGAQGAVFEPSIIPRIEELHSKHPKTIIAVDGGVSALNIGDLVRAGATRFGVGSAISKAPDPKAAYGKLMQIAEQAL